MTVMTLTFFILIGWPSFWALPFAGGLIRDRTRRDHGTAALRTLDITIIAAWVLMLTLVGLLSPNGLFT